VATILTILMGINNSLCNRLHEVIFKDTQFDI